MDEKQLLVITCTMGAGAISLSASIIILWRMSRNQLIYERHSIKQMLYRCGLFGLVALGTPPLLFTFKRLFSVDLFSSGIPLYLIVTSILGISCFIINVHNLARHSRQMSENRFPSTANLAFLTLWPGIGFFLIYQGLFLFIIRIVGTTYRTFVGTILVIFMMLIIGMSSFYLLMIRKRYGQQKNQLED